MELSKEEKKMLFFVALLVHAARCSRMVDSVHSIPTPKTSFNEAEAFMEEAKARGVPFDELGGA